MRTKSFLLLISVTTFMYGCSGSEKEQGVIWDEKNLVGERMYTDPMLLSRFTQPHIFGEYVVSGSNSGGYCFTLSKIQSDSIIYNTDFLSRGRGPKEMFIPNLRKHSINGEYFFYDVNNGLGRIIMTNTDDIRDIHDASNWEELDNIGEIKDVMGLSPLDTNYSSFLTLMPFGNSSNAMFYKATRDSITPLNFNFPKNELGEENIYARHIAYTGLLKKHPEENKYVYFGDQNRHMHIFSFNSDSIKTISEPYTLYPHYILSADGYYPKFPKEYYTGHHGVVVTKKYIYVLINDTQIQHVGVALPNGLPWDYANTVYMFDWDGTPINKLILDVYVYYLFGDMDDQYLYGKNDYVDEQATTIYRFKL